MKLLQNYCRTYHFKRLFTDLCRRAYNGDQHYDVIIVGGGHAGTEAACAAARMGSNTLLITHKLETIGEMSCNPSFGGIGKGHLMKEIDALDGVCARICDTAGIQYKVLNKKKGPAVWGPRAQIDRKLYKQHIQNEVLNTEKLTVLAAAVDNLILREPVNPDHSLMKQSCKGVILENGEQIFSKAVVLTTGTFLRANINIGLTVKPAGRMDDEPAMALGQSLEDSGFVMGRLKTGTPPRLNGSKINYSKTQPMFGDDPPVPFSFLNESVRIKSEDQVVCHMTHTNEKVAQIIHETLHLNRHVHEEVTGPRYCPSIEAKILRFKAKKHQIWLEPEGLDSNVVYPNGISCTMPEEHQIRMVNSIDGLENCSLVKPGYGVEYDYIDPRQLKSSLETLRIENLYFAGQINGTTGYEEAGAQGIVAGINAVLKIQKKNPLIIDRTEGYVGVLIDDLTTLGTSEPYRMFTSRAEFRLSLRPDNADQRLTVKGYNAGCVSWSRYNKAVCDKKQLEENLELLKSFKKATHQWRKALKLRETDNTLLKSAIEVLDNPEVSVNKLVNAFPEVFGHLRSEKALITKLEIEAKYYSHLKVQMQEINAIRQEEQLVLPEDLDYYSLNISTDCKNKLAEARPSTIAAASRIPGLTPAALVLLLNYVKRTQNTHRIHSTKNTRKVS